AARLLVVDALVALAERLLPHHEDVGRALHAGSHHVVRTAHAPVIVLLALGEIDVDATEARHDVHGVRAGDCSVRSLFSPGMFYGRAYPSGHWVVSDVRAPPRVAPS